MTAAPAFERLLARLAETTGQIPKGNERTRTARCPAHPDHNPSLSVTRASDRVLLKCMAGCDVDAVLDALGLARSDLFDAPKAGSNGSSAYTVVAEYHYEDEAGQLLYVVERRSPKDFRQRRPDGHGGWVWNTTGVRRVLFRLPELIAAVAAGRTIHVCEGEADVLALERVGVVATCNPGGAGKWRDEFSTMLAGADVVVIADRDAPGYAHAAQVCSSVAGTARAVQVLEPAVGKDVSDHLAAGRTISELAPITAETAVVMVATALVEQVELVEQLELVVMPPPTDPTAVARRLVRDHHTSGGGDLVLRWWRGDFYGWTGTNWTDIALHKLRAGIYSVLETATYLKKVKKEEIPEPWEPNRYKVADVIEAMQAIVHVDERTDPPAWIVGDDQGEVIPTRNGLVHFTETPRSLTPHTAGLFNLTALPYDFDPDAPEPSLWLRFLKDLWQDDDDSITLLQDFFGYVLSGETNLHKILLLVGPPRSGKGTIARVLTALIGRDNMAAPTLAGLGTNFGLSPLLGKSLGIIGDARLGGPNVFTVVERLLSISGEDTITIDRKYREPWTGRLGVRFMIVSNELPNLGDASGAVANRFLVLALTETWLGRENPALSTQLLTELPGILNWAIAGLDRLRARGYFCEPQASKDAVQALADLSSPVGQFVREECVRGPLHEVTHSDLYLRFRTWCMAQGRDHPPTAAVFGRDLRAAVPGLSSTQGRDGETRYRSYHGIGLRPTGADI